jgi:hypothetical protein
VKIVLLVVLTLVVQRLFGVPGAPAWLAQLELTTVWVVAPALRRHDSSWVLATVLLGVGWDVALDQPVIGPGGIAWSVAALAVTGLTSVVADRSPKAWLACGAIAAVVATLSLQIARLPLGLAALPTTGSLVWTAILSAAWCGVVGWLSQIDFAVHWHRHRSRRLR